MHSLLTSATILVLALWAQDQMAPSLAVPGPEIVMGD